MRIEETGDFELIAKLNEQVQNLHHELYPNKFKPFNYSEVCKYFEKIIEDENQHFHVCYDDNYAVGYIWFSEIVKSDTAFSNESHYLYVQQVSVNERQRGKGVGKMLFDVVLKYSKEKSIKRIGLDYWVKNGIAKKIYERMGFEVEKEITYLNLWNYFKTPYKMHISENLEFYSEWLYIFNG